VQDISKRTITSVLVVMGLNQEEDFQKKLIDWTRQMMFQVKRWLPTRELGVVADSSFAALELLDTVSQAVMPLHIITRLRLDAALYEPAPELYYRYRKTSAERGKIT
jgi:hypothetical protein